MKQLLKTILKPIADFFRKITYKLMRDVMEDLHTSMDNPSSAPIARIPVCEDEYLRIMFLFQMASFWPGWETFYQACLDDPRIIVKFAFLDELHGDITQMLTAKTFLDEKQIPYEVYSDRLFNCFQPHVLVMQTPYDYGHRKAHVRSSAFYRKGTRIVYIPYGIELSDTAHARDAHFCNAVVMNAWRVFTFSERMREDYHRYCSNSTAVKCLGHPKFDTLYHKEKLACLPEIAEKAAGRPIYVWHVHFPKITPQPDGSGIMVTPWLEEYVAFAKYAIEQKDLFFVLQPHPKFLDGEGDLGVKARKIVDMMSASDNACVDWSDDYRNTILNCDYFITDRSALMVEAATAQVPILYMSNKDYYEPLTAAVAPLVESYYQGTGVEDMKRFVQQCRAGEDPRKAEREQAFRDTIPYFDGKSGWRIKEHIVDALYAEQESDVQNQLRELRQQVAELNARLDELNARPQ